MIGLGGDLRWIGWDTNSEIAAAQHDLIVMVFAGKEFTDSDRYPRPGTKQTGSAETGGLFAASIADFNVGAFMEQINS